MAKDLIVNVKVNAKTKELDKMFKRINKMQAKVNQQAKAQDAVTRAVHKTNAAHKKQATLIDGLTTKAHRLANAYLGVMGAKAMLTASDTITSAENKLNHLNNGDTAATQKQLDQMYASAQKTRMGYADMMSNVSKSMTLAGDAFGGNMDNAIRFQEIMAEAYTLSGSSAAEMSSSMYQMIQGLGSGVLQGDELRSVREGASMAYQAIEKYAQGIYGADKNLKDLASQGKITSDIVVAAVLANGEQMDEAFAKTSMTFTQAWTMMKNTALKSFEPVLQKMNDLLNSPIGQAIINGIGMAIQIVAGLALWLFGIIESIFTFIYDNWGVISNVLLTMATILASIVIPMFVKWLISVISATIATLVGVWADVAAFIALAKAEGLAATMAGLFGITINWALLIAIAVIAAVVIAIIWMSDSFADACGNIAGSVWVVVSFIITLVKSLWNYLKAVATNIEIAMSNPWEAAKAAFWGWVADVLEGVRWLEPALNAIAHLFGADGFTLSGTIETVKAKQQASLDKLNYVDANAAFTDTWSNWSVKGAFDKGHAWGSEKATSLTDTISGALNLGALPTANTDGITPNLEDINGNTGKMADSMQLAEEDLAYLRDVANMEWKKEFTTATIKVDMTNNNSVSNDYDLNSLAIGLRDLVEEEMYTVANGVYV